MVFIVSEGVNVWMVKETFKGGRTLGVYMYVGSNGVGGKKVKRIMDKSVSRYKKEMGEG